MEVIRDKSGRIIQRSRNLRGIHEYVGKNLIKVLSISETGVAGYLSGKLCILFDNGASYETNFADFNVLQDCVRRWRNVYGAPLMVNGKDCGKVEYNNPALTA